MLFVSTLAGIAALFFVLVWISDWVHDRDTNHQIEKNRRRDKRHTESYGNIQDPNERAIAARIHAISNKLDAQNEQQQRQDESRKTREIITMSAIGLTALFAFGSDWIFYDQLDEMRNDSRAWVGPVDAAVTTPIIAGQSVKFTVTYNNTGKTPATQFLEAVGAKFYTKDQWADFTASNEIAAFRDYCFSLPPGAERRVAYPTSGFTAYTLHFDSIDDAPTGKTMPATKEFVAGDTFMALLGCFVYVSNSSPHHSSFCFSFQNNKTDASHLSICTIGNDAD